MLVCSKCESSEKRAPQAEVIRQSAAHVQLESRLAGLEANSEAAQATAEAELERWERRHSELRVELAGALRVRETLRADLLDESAAAGQLRRQLVVAEAPQGGRDAGREGK